MAASVILTKASGLVRPVTTSSKTDPVGIIDAMSYTLTTPTAPSVKLYKASAVATLVDSQPPQAGAYVFVYRAGVIATPFVSPGSPPLNYTFSEKISVDDKTELQEFLITDDDMVDPTGIKDSMTYVLYSAVSKSKIWKNGTWVDGSKKVWNNGQWNVT